MAGALEDFARRPTREKVGIFIAAGVVLGLLYYQFAYRPLLKDRDQAQAELEADRQDARQLKSQKDEYDKLVLRQDELKQQIEQNQKALPTESEMPAFFDMLARRTGEAGVEAIKRNIGKEQPIETFVKVPVDIEIVGTFYQLKRFFASLRPSSEPAPAPGPDGAEPVEEKDRIVTIENLSIADPKVKNGEIILTAKFVAATFRAAAQPETPAAPGAKPAPKPGAPAGAAPSPGVTKNPRELGARAEQGAAAGDTRARNAGAKGGP